MTLDLKLLPSLPQSSHDQAEFVLIGFLLEVSFVNAQLRVKDHLGRRMAKPLPPRTVLIKRFTLHQMFVGDDESFISGRV